MLPQPATRDQACPEARGAELPRIVRCECCGRALYPSEGKVCHPCERYVARVLAEARLAPRHEGRQACQHEASPC